MALVPLMTGCGGSPEPIKAAPSPSFELLDEEVGAKIGADGVMLIYCIPGLPGSPRDGCDHQRLLDGVAETVAALDTRLKAAPPDVKYATVPTAIDRANAAIKGFRRCKTWFNRGARTNDFGCHKRWEALTTAWKELKVAAGY
ncbi:hypothetical protein DP939_31770 [Spongiactinospora rosea]|uniref:Uncharacterized protein n=1 Tax=Spongiactinospora rosea TaxID=2248750 RepID=A0A366LSA6_9ACTN|nr:hypothetical protein [Spongiactinospora rosea]RBQ16194.1 hypothetical protein DP939_31770 [Spongiactinospora rosea]